MNATGPRKTPRLVVETAAADALSTPGEAMSLSDQPTEYLAGEVIADRYRLVRELGRGGMGIVWVAHSLVLDVDVALKLIRARSAGPGVASRMAREAHATARLGHPALVRVFDFGWTNRGDPFLVMELVPGETLSQLLQREKRIDAIRAVQLILPVADGLRVAHDKHVVHRDIKPDNIFLATDAFGRRQPKLLDFGIAKVEFTTQDRRLTQMGVVLGSPEYMSPEQSRGMEDVDDRTDVWSLCVVLYELVTGSIPFSKPNYNALMHSIIHDEPRSMQHEAAGDASLWEIVKRGLAKNRDERWSSMTELGEALAQWLHEHGTKEDISGNSLRAVWLDGALVRSREHIRVVASEPQPQPQHREPFVSTPSDSPEPTPSPTTTTTPLASNTSSRKRTIVTALALAAAALTGFAISALTFGIRDPVRPATLTIETSPDRAGPLRTAATEPSVSAATASPAASASTAPPKPEIEEDVTSARAGSARTAAGTKESSLSKAAPAAPPRNRVSRPLLKRVHDFGF